MKHSFGDYCIQFENLRNVAIVFSEICLISYLPMYVIVYGIGLTIFKVLSTWSYWNYTIENILCSTIYSKTVFTKFNKKINKIVKICKTKLRVLKCFGFSICKNVQYNIQKRWYYCVGD